MGTVKILGFDHTTLCYVVIALGEHVKKNNCEQSIFKALDKVDKDFDNKFSNLKVAQARNQYQYSDFTANLQKVKSRFQNSHSKIRCLDRTFNGSLTTSPIIEVREDFVIRLTRMHQKKKSSSNSHSHTRDNSNMHSSLHEPSHSSPVFRKQLSMPGSSRDHNLKQNTGFIDDYNGMDSAIGSSITSSSKTLVDHQPRSRRRGVVRLSAGQRAYLTVVRKVFSSHVFNFQENNFSQPPPPFRH